MRHSKAVSRILSCFLLAGFLCFLIDSSLLAQQQSVDSLQISLGSSSELSLPVRIAIFLTLLTFVPAILVSMTSFVRIMVVMHFLRQALATQQAPNNQVLIGLALFLSLFIMGPVWDRVYDEALVPYQAGRLSELDALAKAEVPLREFMLKQVREDDLALFVKIGNYEKPRTPEDLPFRVIVPAFLVSELKTAFQIGFVLFLPFLVIDMVISAVLLSMGMLQLPPVMISTPFKLLLFILVDGWGLIVGSLAESFRM